MVVELENRNNGKALGPDMERLRLEHKYSGLIEEELSLAKYVSYVGNKSVPILQLYRYKEAFSFALVTDFLKRFQITMSNPPQPDE